MSTGREQEAGFRALATGLVGAFVRGGKIKPVLPEGRRDEVVAALTRLLLDTEALDAYAAALDAERRRQGVDLLLLDLPCLDLPDRQVAREGFARLSDDQLADLAIDPVALKVLHRSLVGDLGPEVEASDWWWEALGRGEQLRYPGLAQRTIQRVMGTAGEEHREQEDSAPIDTASLAPPSPPAQPVLIILVTHPARRAATYRGPDDSPSEPTGEPAGCEWVCTTPEGDSLIPLPAEVARRCYGPEDQKVRIHLVAAEVVGEPGLREPQLKVWPAPARDLLTCDVAYAGGLSRTLTIPVPRGGAGAWAWSRPCEPLPASAFGAEQWELTLAFT